MPLSLFLSLGRRLLCRHSGVRASPAICSADRLTILAVTTLIARGISTLTGRTDRLKDALRSSVSIRWIKFEIAFQSRFYEEESYISLEKKSDPYNYWSGYNYINPIIKTPKTFDKMLYY